MSDTPHLFDFRSIHLRIKALGITSCCLGFPHRTGFFCQCNPPLRALNSATQHCRAAFVFSTPTQFWWRPWNLLTMFCALSAGPESLTPDSAVSAELHQNILSGNSFRASFSTTSAWIRWWRTQFIYTSMGHYRGHKYGTLQKHDWWMTVCKHGMEACRGLFLHRTGLSRSSFRGPSPDLMLNASKYRPHTNTSKAVRPHRRIFTFSGSPYPDPINSCLAWEFLP